MLRGLASVGAPLRRAAVPRAAQRPAQRRLLHKNAFVEEWDASKTNLHKTFKFDGSAFTTFLFGIVAFPTFLFIATMDEMHYKGQRDLVALEVAPAEDDE